MMMMMVVVVVVVMMVVVVVVVVVVMMMMMMIMMMMMMTTTTMMMMMTMIKQAESSLSTTAQGQARCGYQDSINQDIKHHLRENMEMVSKTDSQTHTPLSSQRGGQRRRVFNLEIEIISRGLNLNHSS